MSRTRPFEDEESTSSHETASDYVYGTVGVSWRLARLMLYRFLLSVTMVAFIGIVGLVTGLSVYNLRRNIIPPPTKPKTINPFYCLGKRLRIAVDVSKIDLNLTNATEHIQTAPEGVDVHFMLLVKIYLSALLIPDSRNPGHIAFVLGGFEERICFIYMLRNCYAGHQEIRKIEDTIGPDREYGTTIQLYLNKSSLAVKFPCTLTGRGTLIGISFLFDLNLSRRTFKVMNCNPYKDLQCSLIYHNKAHLDSDSELLFPTYVVNDGFGPVKGKPDANPWTLEANAFTWCEER